MIGVVVTGHLNFASGYQSALLAIAGDTRQIEYVDFLESMSTDDLEQSLCVAVDKVDSGDGVLFLTDIQGGSPFQKSAKLAGKLNSSDVIAGTNLAMCAEAFMEREDLPMQELVDHVIETGIENIISLRKEMGNSRQTADSGDGI